jgi:hypothetical protein
MDSIAPTMSLLFDQLGLAADEASIESFIQAHRPVPLTTRLFDAPFWSPSQAALIQQKLQDDGEWSVLIDTLNVRLRHPPGTR